MADRANFKCFLGNLSHSAEEDAITKALEHIPSFAGAKIMYDKFDGKPRGFGWAFFNDTQGVKAAQALSNRILIHGRALTIQPPNDHNGGAEEDGGPPKKKRKPHKPVTGAIEIAHAHLADIDKSAYQAAMANQKRQRSLQEASAALHPPESWTHPMPAADGPRGKASAPSAPVLPVQLTVRAKGGAGAPSKPAATALPPAPREGAEAAAAGQAARDGTSERVRAKAPAAAAPSSNAIALLQAYGESDDDGGDSEDDNH